MELLGELPMPFLQSLLHNCAGIGELFSVLGWMRFGRWDFPWRSWWQSQDEERLLKIGSAISEPTGGNARTIRSVKASYLGPAIDDTEFLARLPQEISSALQSKNGFIAAGGGFHVRGACLRPAWHSIRAAWEGEFALHRLFPAVR
jgi:hypothetical protein